MTRDEKFMERCIQLARGGHGHVAPNPLVGSVIVFEDQIIGEGFHTCFGKPHAEREALSAVSDKYLLPAATLYVNLEPCNHHGKTPPCVDAILEARIPRVVISCRDPFEKVAGRGIEMLCSAGVEVVQGVLQEKGRWLNRRFFTYHEKKRPYIMLKWAQTEDGYIDRVRTKTGTINSVSSSRTRKWVHLMRSREAAILVGKNTVINDNPSLTVRDIQGKNPIRIVLDSQLQLPGQSDVFDTKAPTIVFNQIKEEVKGNIQWVGMKDVHKLDALLARLHQLGILSVMVEGGTEVLQNFIDAGLWDEARVIHAAGTFGNGLRAPELPFEAVFSQTFDTDVVHHYRNA